MYKIYIFFLTLDSYRGEGIHCIRHIFPFNETHQEWERKNIYRIPIQSIFFHIVRDKNAYIYIYIDSYHGEGIHCIRYIFPFNETHQE